MATTESAEAKPSNKKTILFIALGAIVLSATVGGGVYYFMSHKAHDVTTSSNPKADDKHAKNAKKAKKDPQHAHDSKKSATHDETGGTVTTAEEGNHPEAATEHADMEASEGKTSSVDQEEAVQVAENTESVKDTISAEEEDEDALAEEEDEDEEEEEEEEGKKPAFYFPLDPPFVVNFQSRDGKTRYLKVELQGFTRKEPVVEEVKTHMPMIRNSMVMLFSKQIYEEILTPEGKEALRKQALKDIQKIMKKETGKKGVLDLFFTSFVMQ